MQAKAFEGIHQAENSWFYHSRAFAIQRILTLLGVHNEKICEIGAGYGAMSAKLRPFGKVTAFEPATEPRKKCAENCDELFPGTDIEELIRERKQSFSLVALLDVIEHVEDDIAFAQQLRGLLTPGGHILVTVPAYQWLWSELDVLAMHHRRYTKAHILQVLEAAGFEIEYATYWNALLLLPAAVVRLGTGKAGYSALSLPKWIDRLFFEWVRLESRLIPYLSLPFGTSVFVYARLK